MEDVKRVNCDAEQASEKFQNQQAAQLREATLELPVPPVIAGVYFLLKEGLVVFVGDSEDVAQCVKHKKRESYDEVRYVAIPKTPVFLKKDVVRAFIHFFRPPNNEIMPAVDDIHDYDMKLVNEYMIPLSSPLRKR